MKKLFLSLMLLASFTPSLAEPIETTDYNTPHAMGCMLLQECTDGVIEITSMRDLEKYYGEVYPISSVEFDELIKASNKAGVKVYLAPNKYFLPRNRGVYHTVGNNFFLNEDYMSDSAQLMSVMRHEGWHAVQDCMAGTIDNGLIAIVHDEEDVPQFWKDIASDTYPESVLPWEQEAMWAGHEEYMTLDALRVCGSDQKLWEVYDPTPLTREYLESEGYIK